MPAMKTHALPRSRRAARSAIILSAPFIVSLFRATSGRTAFVPSNNDLHRASIIDGHRDDMLGRRGALGGAVAVMTMSTSMAGWAEAEEAKAEEALPIKSEVKDVMQTMLVENDGLPTESKVEDVMQTMLVEKDGMYSFKLPTSGPFANFEKAEDGVYPNEVTAYGNPAGSQITVGPISERGYLKNIRNSKLGPGSGIRTKQFNTGTSEDVWQYSFQGGFSRDIGSGINTKLGDEWWYRILKVDGEEKALMRVKINTDGMQKDFGTVVKPAVDDMVATFTLL